MPEVTSPASPIRLELKGIRKAFPSVVANDGIDLAVAPGSIHALLGENGAGKSTLMKIVYGVMRADMGRILWNGVPADIASPSDARALGIGMVFQHFSLFPALSVAENIALALPGTRDLGAVSERARQVSARYGIPIDPGRAVHTLSVGEQQRVEVVRNLLQEPELLIMDEPTSVLTPLAIRELFRMLRQLAAPLSVAVYPEGYHMLLRDLESDVVHADIAAWIASPNAPLPSGNDISWQNFFSNE